MIENLVLSVNTVAPLFLMMLTGFLLRKFRLFDLQTIKKMNRIVFSFFLPVLIIQSVYSGNITESFNPAVILFAVIGIVLIWAVAMVIVPRIIKDNATRGVIIQSFYRSNYILFAIPIIRQLYGDGNTGITDLLIVISMPLYNILAVITFEKYRDGKINIIQILSAIVKNPIVIASVIGILLQLFNVKLGYIPEKALLDISRAATPVALIILGGFFEFSGSLKYIKSILITSGMKLIIIPAVFVSISVLLGFRNVDLATLFVLFGAPLAVSSFIMAVEMDGNADLAGRLLVFTSAGSMFSIFLGLFILRSLMLI